MDWTATFRQWLTRGGAGRLAVMYGWSLFVWFFLGLAFALQQYRNAAAAGAQVEFLNAARVPIVFYLVFALLTPPVFLLTRWCGFHRSQWWKAVVTHAVGAVVFAFLHATIRLALLPARRPSTGEVLPFTAGTIVEMAQTLAFEYIWMYCTIGGIAYAADYYRRLRERDLEEAKLQARIATFELQALRMQIHPHFLFNTLHAISTLMVKDVHAARSMIVRLSELLRVSMENVFVAEVSLRKELQFLESYLGIEQARFGSRLKVEWQIDQETLAARAPSLLLQPLVENAIKHGIGAQLEPGTISIQSQRINGSLRLRISNDGPAETPGLSLTAGSGVGLANTRARLQQLYGSEQRLDFRTIAGGGAEVMVEIPFKIQPEEDDSE